MGGKLSVRFPEGKKELVMLGHDECIFKQYHFTNKLWVRNDNTRPILPQDKGAGLMISAFQCCEFGFGHPLTKEELEQVNQKRVGETYMEEDAVMLNQGKKEKEPLTSSPFYIEFE